MEWFRNILRSRRCREIERWRADTVKRLITEVFPADTPYIYQSAPSFLQVEGLDTGCPIRVDLFLQEYPLAIDLLGPESSLNYKDASPYISRPAWEKLHRDLAGKKRVLLGYRCPHLILNYDEPTDSNSLNDRLLKLTGSYPSLR